MKIEPDILAYRRPNYLEGMRGLAAWLVVINHAMNSFIPLCYADQNILRHVRPDLLKFFYSPLDVLLVGGNFAVMLFFVHSGFVLSYKHLFSTDTVSLVGDALKRYTRLAIPAILSVMMAYVVMSLGWMHQAEVAFTQDFNTWLIDQYNFEPHFWLALKQGVIDYFFNKHDVDRTISYNTSLWTIQIEYAASLLVFLILFLRKTKLKYLAYAFVIIRFFKSFYFPFLLGHILAQIYIRKNHWLKESRLGILFFFFGLWLSSLKPGDTGPFLWFEYLNHFGLATTIESFGGLFVIVGIIKTGALNRFLETKPLIYLGKISYSVYLLHSVILISLGCGAYIWTLRSTSSPALAFSAGLITTLLGTLMASHFYVRVDKLAIHLGRAQKQYFLNAVQKWRPST